jgi:predicted metalloprotease with PDZ domain
MPTDYFKSVETRRKSTDLTYSLGLALNKDGDLTAVQWDGPAFKAGLTDGMKVIAVNGLGYDAERIKDAVQRARGAGDPVELIVKAGDRYKTIKIPYNGGLRYPKLERVAGTPDRLGEILTPRR